MGVTIMCGWERGIGYVWEKSVPGRGGLRGSAWACVAEGRMPRGEGVAMAASSRPAMANLLSSLCQHFEKP